MPPKSRKPARSKRPSATESAAAPAARSEGPPRPDRTPAWICLALVLLTFAVFGQTVRFDFVNFDDDGNIVDNPAVSHGFTVAGVAQAFTYGKLANWDPLTVLSHQLDCQLFGLWAGGHHLTNVILHAATVLILFLVLRRMTGALWPSAFVAALFAIHPLRVESVAWVTERKDVLSGLFFMLTLAAYIRYARQPAVKNYLLLLLCYALGLMSKAMLVTVPGVLLFLDFWPLRRFTQEKNGAWPRLVIEKIPLVLMALAATFVGVLAQRASNAVQTLDRYPLTLRVENSVVSLAAYLWQMICPVHLAVLYPFPFNGIPAWEIVFAVVAVAAISVFAWRSRRERPYLLAGWLWYLAMLLPVIGLVQLGEQARADRYTYLPQIGIYLGVTWLAAAALKRWKNPGKLPALAAGAVIALYSVAAFAQTRRWQNSETLWTATLAHTADNASAESHFGAALLKDGRVDEAVEHFEKALAIDPARFRTRVLLGNAFSQKGRLADALDQYQQAVRLSPGYALAHYNLGMALIDAHQPDQAITELDLCLQLDAQMADAHLGLATALGLKGRMAEAEAQCHQVIDSQPRSPAAHATLGDLLAREGKLPEAIAQFQSALEINPGYAPALASIDRIAWLLATCPDPSVRNGHLALRLAQQISGLNPVSPSHLCVLAAAQAETGQFDQAVATAETAQHLALLQGKPTLAGALAAQLDAYRQHQPFRDTGNPATRPGF